MTFLGQTGLAVVLPKPRRLEHSPLDQQGVGQWVSGEEARTLGTLPHEAETALPRVRLPSMRSKLREGLTRSAPCLCPQSLPIDGAAQPGRARHPACRTTAGRCGSIRVKRHKELASVWPQRVRLR